MSTDCGGSHLCFWRYSPPWWLRRVALGPAEPASLLLLILVGLRIRVSLSAWPKASSFLHIAAFIPFCV